MDEIKELVQVVSKHKIKQIDILDQSLDPESKMSMYYNMLREGKLSDQEMAEALGYTGARDRSFHKLRNRLKKRLINTTFFIDVNQPTFTDYQKAYNTTYKDWGAVRLLLFRAARQTSMSLAKSIINTAIRYHFTDIVVLLAKDLRNHYAQHVESKKDYEYYNSLFDTYNYYFQKEAYVENLMNRFLLDSKEKSKNKVDRINEKYEKLYQQIENGINEIPTYRYRLVSYFFMVNVLERLNKYEDILELNESARQFFNNLSFTSPIVINTINQQEALAYLKLKQYDKSIDTLDRIMDIPASGSIGWYYNRIYNILANIHIHNYDYSYKLLNECLNHRKFDGLLSTYKQFILIIEAYMSFIRQSNNKEHRSNFRIGKFLNEVPTYSKEKRGLNISILIVHFLFLIQQNKYLDAIDRVESLNQYCYRYLRRDENFRSNAFIKMLIQVSKADFHPVRAKRYAKKYYTKLKSVPMEIADQPIDVEIVPYEDLWEMVISVLKINQRQASYG